jgi:hypothetical protein
MNIILPHPPQPTFLRLRLQTDSRFRLCPENPENTLLKQTKRAHRRPTSIIFSAMRSRFVPPEKTRCSIQGDTRLLKYIKRDLTHWLIVRYSEDGHNRVGKWRSKG